MGYEDFEEPSSTPRAGGSAWLIPLVILALIGAGGVSYLLLRRNAGPPPVEIAGDPLLVQGRALYLDRCVSCHGPEGRGDGPIARGLSGPPPGNLADDDWKHGDRPDQVLGVLIRGVPESSMPAWKGIFTPEQIRAVAAYVYHLAGRPVPDELRAG